MARGTQGRPNLCNRTVEADKVTACRMNTGIGAPSSRLRVTSASVLLGRWRIQKGNRLTRVTCCQQRRPRATQPGL